MDKNAIKKYAVWARRELVEKVTQKALQYGIEDGVVPNIDIESINGTLLTATERKQRQALIRRISEEGFEQVMEEVAYTWFNRFIALRFMEVNGYLPSHVRVFTDDNNNFRPQILTEALHIELQGIDKNKIYEMKENNQEEELFKYLLIAQCNDLNSILPVMFQKIADYTELLLPDYLLREGSIIDRLIRDVEESDFDVSSKGGELEIIGWFYQYYISEKHEEVVNISNKGPVKKQDIPAATQLFTTNWVVRYIIDNSIGRYWIEHSNSAIHNELDFFIGQNVSRKLEEKISPEELTFFDPCIGSGHFAIYAFDLFLKIYREYGYSDREAVEAILKYNIFGLDIDGRAAQLAYFSLMMKARQYDRRFFQKGIQPHIYAICESNHIEKYVIDYFCAGDSYLEKEINDLVLEFRDAKNYGSLIDVKKKNWENINKRISEIEDDISLEKMAANEQLVPLIRVAEIMAAKYKVVATNPPYLNKYNEDLKQYLLSNYKDYSADLFSVFIYRNLKYATADGYAGFMTPFVWMYIKSYEKLRKHLIDNKGITTLIQMEYSAYEEATVPICTFVLTNDNGQKVGSYFDLSAFTGGMEIQKIKVLEAIEDNTKSYFHSFDKSNFYRIEGFPIAFMASEKLLSVFESAQPLKAIAEPKVGLQTAKNDLFLRLWFECDYSKIGFGYTNLEDTNDGVHKWIPYNKGGAFRRWYGNRSYVINWEYNGSEVRKYPGAVIRNPQFYLKPCITWSDITSASFSGRYCEGGFLFDVKGSSGFPTEENLKYVLGFLNSKISQKCIKILNPTISTQVGDMARIPVYFDRERKSEIDKLVEDCVEIAKKDWDAHEQSFDFKRHPLLEYGEGKIADAFSKWEEDCKNRFIRLKKNEERINELFIDIYGLENEIDSSVDEKSLEASCGLANREKDIKSLIVYAVGCMFGRYSLEQTGIICANNYTSIPESSLFSADNDDIIPITDDEYFEDDIVVRFIEFIKAAFGEDDLEENLSFIADSLKGSGTPKNKIREYFMNDVYTDICDIYSLSGAGKRPIYWMFDSGKKNGFKCLIYMHRYREDIIARIRTDYVHELQSRYRTAIDEIEQRLFSASGSDKVKLDKKLKTLKEQEEELHEYEEQIHHLADQMISIDLDDGVKKNYEIFKDVLAKIK